MHEKPSGNVGNAHRLSRGGLEALTETAQLMCCMTLFQKTIYLQIASLEASALDQSATSKTTRLSFGLCCLLLDARGRQTYQPAKFSSFQLQLSQRPVKKLH